MGFISLFIIKFLENKIQKQKPDIEEKTKRP